jgi:hypothetical protein
MSLWQLLEIAGAETAASGAAVHGMMALNEYGRLE